MNKYTSGDIVLKVETGEVYMIEKTTYKTVLTKNSTSKMHNNKSVYEFLYTCKQIGQPKTYKSYYETRLDREFLVITDSILQEQYLNQYYLDQEQDGIGVAVSK